MRPLIHATSADGIWSRDAIINYFVSPLVHAITKFCYGDTLRCCQIRASTEEGPSRGCLVQLKRICHWDAVSHHPVTARDTRNSVDAILEIDLQRETGFT
jgi:hypothetical protein